MEHLCLTKLFGFDFHVLLPTILHIAFAPLFLLVCSCSFDLIPIQFDLKHCLREPMVSLCTWRLSVPGRTGETGYAGLQRRDPLFGGC